MEPISFASFTLAGVLATLPVQGEPVSQTSITTHISPAIAGQWEIDLGSTEEMSKRLTAITKSDELPVLNRETSDEPKVTSKSAGGVLEQNERRSIKTMPNIDSDESTLQNVNARTSANNQCRELYNFKADNEMTTVSGKELTYGRYIVTHRDQGLPIIAMQTIYDNNEVDCSGNQVDQTDEALVAFLKYDGNNMQWCADAEGEECFMDFNRVLP